MSFDGFEQRKKKKKKDRWSSLGGWGGGHGCGIYI